MLNNDLINTATKFIQAAGSIVVITHEKPDGDAIASLVAMREILPSMTKARIDLVCRDKVPRAFNFLPHTDCIQHDFLLGDYDLIITLDCGDAKRTGFADRLSQRNKDIPLINIDHHLKNDLHKIATINLVNHEAASTTQLLLEFCRQSRVAISANIATDLLTGLFTDTGSFQHPTTTTESLAIAAEMLAKGARLVDLQKNLVISKSVPMLKLWGLVLQRLKLTSHGLTISVVTSEDIKVTGASEEDLSGVVAMLEATANCRVALLLAQIDDNKIKGSLRSNNSRVDVSKIAKLFGGGGHSRASGFVVDGRLIVDGNRWSVV